MSCRFRNTCERADADVSAVLRARYDPRHGSRQLNWRATIERPSGDLIGFTAETYSAFQPLTSTTGFAAPNSPAR